MIYLRSLPEYKEPQMNPTAHKPRSAKWMLALITVITTSCFAGASSSETTKIEVRPPDQWTWFPEFSPDGKKVAVNWPAPPIIDKDGKLTRVYGKFVKGFSSQMLPTNLAATKRTSPVMLSNQEYQQSIIVDSRTYELLATLPQRLSNVEWSPNGKLLLGNPFSSDNITVFDDAGYQQYGGCLRC